MLVVKRSEISLGFMVTLKDSETHGMKCSKRLTDREFLKFIIPEPHSVTTNCQQ
jgi:hypothetical protein